MKEITDLEYRTDAFRTQAVYKGLMADANKMIETNNYPREKMLEICYFCDTGLSDDKFLFEMSDEELKAEFLLTLQLLENPYVLWATEEKEVMLDSFETLDECFDAASSLWRKLCFSEDYKYRRLMCVAICPSNAVYYTFENINYAENHQLDRRKAETRDLQEWEKLIFEYIHIASLKKGHDFHKELLEFLGEDGEEKLIDILQRHLYINYIPGRAEILDRE